MKFMTRGDLSNIIKFADFQRRRRLESEKRKEEQKREEKRERISTLGKEFMRLGDYSPESLQNFVQENRLDPQEFATVAEIAVKWNQLNKKQRVLREEAVPGTPGQRRVVSLGPGETYTPVSEARPRERKGFWGYEPSVGREVYKPLEIGATREQRPVEPTPAKPLTVSQKYQKALSNKRASLGQDRFGGLLSEHREELDEYSQVLRDTLTENEGLSLIELENVAESKYQQRAETKEQRAKILADVPPAPKTWLSEDEKSGAIKVFQDSLAAGNTREETVQRFKDRKWSDERINLIQGEVAPEAPAIPRTTPTGEQASPATVAQIKRELSKARAEGRLKQTEAELREAFADQLSPEQLDEVFGTQTITADPLGLL